jgi:Zn-dependent peptidase ImmA (M78 family)
MANYASGVNPILLKWAREKAGYSVEDVARSFKKRVEDVLSWESGEDLPTYNQLETLAYSLYKRPIAIFFFPGPPEELDPRQSFRTLPDFEVEKFLPDTRNAIREAMAMQLALHELNDGKNPSERKILKDLQISARSGITRKAIEVREYLRIPLETQCQWSDADTALKNWREVVQDNGVFVFKRSFKQEDFCGFCLVDPTFPVIYLNNSTSKSRQIFTLFHELAHLLLNSNGITTEDDRYIESLTGDSRNIEVFCNRFTAEFLVPSHDLERRLITNDNPDRLAEKLANRYKVSREVILRKLLDKQIVDSDYYYTKVSEWNAEYKKTRQKKKRAGGDYYATQATYLGGKFLGLAFGKYYEGQYSLEQLAGYLNVKAKSVAGLEQFVLGSASIQ